MHSPCQILYLKRQNGRPSKHDASLGSDQDKPSWWQWRELKNTEEFMVPGLDKLDKTDATVVSGAALLIIAEAIFVGSRKQGPVQCRD
jgi:hypothetical protein